MQITIKRVSASRKDDHIILLAEKDEQIPSAYFSKDEYDFVKAQRKADRKTILINQYRRTIYVQMLEKSTKPLYFQLEAARKAGATAAGQLQQAKREEILVEGSVDPKIALAFAEGMVLGSYQFLRYRSAKKTETNTLKKVGMHIIGLTDKEVDKMNILCTAVFQARDLVNEPLSFLNATELGKQFTRMGKEAGFKVQVLNKAQITRLKMGGLLAVNLGSIDPPTFTIMEWKPKNATNKKPIVLIGKGVVYDTGGLSLKPTPNSMDYMKCDMGGSAAVGAAMYAIAKTKMPLHVIALVPATDNRPGGNAYVPGDVIMMMSGKTVEVLNTDAEGRMILADALHYAERFKPELVMDFATLTGAAATAIGQYGIVCMGTADEKEKAAMKEAGNTVYERLAEFPFWDEYNDLIKSDIADYKNVGGPVGGAITAGKFLANFTTAPYMHFDIAGPAWSKGNDSYRGKNGTGYGARFIVEYLTKKIK